MTISNLPILLVPLRDEIKEMKITFVKRFDSQACGSLLFQQRHQFSYCIFVHHLECCFTSIKCKGNY